MLPASHKKLLKNFLIQNRFYGSKGKIKSKNWEPEVDKEKYAKKGKADLSKFDKKKIERILLSQDEEKFDLSKKLIERAIKRGDVDPDSPISHEGQSSLEEKAEKEEKLTGEESYIEDITKFKEQYGWDDAFDEKLLMETKKNTYGNATLNFNKKKLQQFQSKEEVEFEKYSKQKGAKVDMNLIESLSDFFNEDSKLVLEQPDGTKQTIDLSHLTQDEEISEEPEVDKAEFTLNALKIQPGTFQEEQNPAFKHLYTNSIENISISDFNKIFIMPEQHYEKYFKENKLGEELEENFERISQRALMLRTSIEPVVRHLNLFQKGKQTTNGYLFSKKKENFNTVFSWNVRLWKEL
jgi:hypothetical protein